MKLQNRIEILVKLKKYIQENCTEWQETKQKASVANGWFTQEFIDLSVNNIVDHFLDENKLQAWINHYHIDDNVTAKNVGIVMAGNIPLVGLHDMLCVFIAGHKANIKASSKDQALIKHLVNKMAIWNDEIKELIIFSEMLKGCYFLPVRIEIGGNRRRGFFPRAWMAE